MDNVQNAIIVLIYHLHKLSHEDRSIFWEVMVSAILSKKVHVSYSERFARKSYFTPG
jgi:hypothetical protein